MSALIRSPHISERQFPTPPLHSNPSWIYPETINPVTVYEITLRGTITQTKGWYDREENTWKRVNGKAMKILGWV